MNDSTYQPPDPRARRILAARLVAMLVDGKAGADKIGELVREAWVEWARAQPDPKPSWLVPWAQLGQADQEADRLIGIRVAEYVITWLVGQLDILDKPARAFTAVEVQTIMATLEANEQEQPA